MVKAHPVSASDLFAMHLAVKSERSGVAIKQIAEAGCSGEVIALAEDIRALLAEMRHDARKCGDEQGMAQDRVDAAFDKIVAEVLKSSGRVH